MAARIQPKLTQAWREKIRTSMLINRLMKHVEDKPILDASQVTAAVALLRKTIPDLSQQDLNIDADVRNRVISAATVTPAEWAAQHSNGSNGKANGSSDRLGSANGAAESTD